MNASILPVTDDPESQGFWDAAHDGRLVVQHCSHCGRLRFPPHPGCPECHRGPFTWQAVSGRALLWSFVIVHGPTLTAFQQHVPFPVGVVTLIEAPHLRMVGNLIAAPGAAINSLDPKIIRIGMSLAVTFHQVEDVALPAWVPA